MQAHLSVLWIFAWVFLDACAQVEEAHDLALRPSLEALVATESLEPAGGDTQRAGSFGEVEMEHLHDPERKT